MDSITCKEIAYDLTMEYIRQSKLLYSHSYTHEEIAEKFMDNYHKMYNALKDKEL